MHDGVKDKDLTREQIIARHLKVVEAHFHNETPESVDKAIALYDDEIVWERANPLLILDNRSATQRRAERFVGKRQRLIGRKSPAFWPNITASKLRTKRHLNK